MVVSFYHIPGVSEPVVVQGEVSDEDMLISKLIKSGEVPVQGEGRYESK